MRPSRDLSIRSRFLVATIALLGLLAAGCAAGIRVPRIGSQTGVRTWSSNGSEPAEEIRDASGAPWGP